MKTRLIQFFTGVLTAGVLAFSPVQADCGSNSCSKPRSCESDCCDFDGSLYVDLLVWDTCNCIDFYSTTAGTMTTSHYADYDWDLGFRVGGTWAACDDWNLNVDFTYFSSDADDKYTGVATSGLELNPATYLVATDSTYKADLDYYTLDLLLSKKCCACDKFVMRPFGGFRALWTEQNFSETGTVAGPLASATSADYDVDAYGLHSGLEFEWCAFGPLTFVGKFGASLLVGEREFTQSQSEAGTVTAAQTRNTDLSCPFGYETSVGLDYQDEICDYDFGLRASYELVHWSDIGNPYDFNSDLGFHGLTLQARIEF